MKKVSGKFISPIVSEQKRNCPHCGEIKPLDQFKYSSSYADRRSINCIKCIDKVNELKSSKRGLGTGLYIRWGVKNIKTSVERFKTEFGHYPSATDFDRVDYLPSPSVVHDTYGGFEKLRKKMGYTETHFGRGERRSKIAKDSGITGLDLEQRIEKILVQRFKEPYVHSQKRFMVDGKKVNIDFYVYSPSVRFGVDLFNSTGTFRDLQNNVNSKLRKYESIPIWLIIVPESDISQERINKWISSKKVPLSQNVRVYTMDTFTKWISKLNPFPDLPS